MRNDALNEIRLLLNESLLLEPLILIEAAGMN